MRLTGSKPSSVKWFALVARYHGDGGRGSSGANVEAVTHCRADRFFSNCGSDREVVLFSSWVGGDMKLRLLTTFLLCGAASASAITLYWVNNSSSQDGVQVERATISNGTWSVLGSVSGMTTSYVDVSALCVTSYYYRICAYNSGGTSDYSNVAGPAVKYCPNAVSSPTTPVHVKTPTQ